MKMLQSHDDYSEKEKNKYKKVANINPTMADEI